MKYFFSENPTLERQVDSFFESLAQVNARKYGNSLSILLLGSLSRGEASWQRTADRQFQLLSDVEFFTVYPDGFASFEEFDADLKRASEEAFGVDNLNLFHVDNTYVKKTGLPRMERKLLIYDATVFGKCVVGEEIVNLLPKVTIVNINLCDIWDIMTHRVFSVLYYGFPLKIQGLENEYRYSLAKNSLDLMTLILVSNGRLESGFANRLNIIRELSVPREWIDYFSFCLSLKLGSKCACEYAIPEMERLFEEILKEMAKTFHVPVRNLILNAKYVVRRRLGMLKRALICKHIPPTCQGHLDNLISRYEERVELSPKDMLDNYILHGYPKRRKRAIIQQ